MAKWRKWRDVAVQELLVLGFVTSGVLVVTDWLDPETRVRGIGLLIGMVSCTAWVVTKFNRMVSNVWDAGGRAERRRAELEAAQPGLTVVRDAARPR